MLIERLAKPVALACLLVLVGAACDGGSDETGQTEAPNSAEEDEGDPAPAEGEGEVSVATPAFGYEEPIPQRFSRAGENVSPAVTWEIDVEGAAELVLLVDDPDAPTDEPFVHWMVAGLDPSSTGVDEGDLPDGAVEGRNDAGDVGWGGPAPPEGETHRYFFRVLVLDAPSGLEEGFSRPDLEAVLDEHFLLSAETVAVFPG